MPYLLGSALHSIGLSFTDSFEVLMALTFIFSGIFSYMWLKEIWQSTEYFTDIYSLCQHFKLTGTALPKSNCGNGLSGKKKLEFVTNAYIKDNKTQTLPLSYHYLFMVLEK